MSLRRMVSVVTLAVVLSSCSTRAESPSADDDTTTPASSAPTSEEPDPREVYQEALDTVMTEPITDFRFEWMLREQRLIMVEGFADVRAGWRATVEMVDPESGESHIINALSSHDASWMQMESWPAEANGCWLAMGPTQVPLGIQGLVRAEPSYISLLGGLQAEGFAGSAQGRFTGELTLAGALTLLQAQTLEHIDIDESTAADHTVPVRITHQDGRLTGVSLTGEELGQGVEDAGGSMPPQVATILDASEFTVTYTAHTGDDTIEAPDDELVMSGDGTGCHE